MPFLLHDSSLHRTTNINSVFPDLVYKDPSYFNISQLKMLSAGEWFIEVGKISVLISNNRLCKCLYVEVCLLKIHK